VLAPSEQLLISTDSPTNIDSDDMEKQASKELGSGSLVPPTGSVSEHDKKRKANKYRM
jgi:hypothetical protein